MYVLYVVRIWHGAWSLARGAWREEHRAEGVGLWKYEF